MSSLEQFGLHWYNPPFRPQLSLPRCTAAINITVPGKSWDVMVPDMEVSSNLSPCGSAAIGLSVDLV